MDNHAMPGSRVVYFNIESRISPDNENDYMLGLLSELKIPYVAIERKKGKYIKNYEDIILDELGPNDILLIHVGLRNQREFISDITKKIPNEIVYFSQLSKETVEKREHAGDFSVFDAYDRKKITEKIHKHITMG